MTEAGRDNFHEATYDLDELKVLLGNEATRRITLKARTNAARLGFITDDEIVGECLAIQKADFYKTMPSEKVPTLWQDVYKRRCRDIPCYIKLQKGFAGTGVIIQFKLDESAEAGGYV